VPSRRREPEHYAGIASVILEDYGPVRMMVETDRQLSRVGSWYSMVGHFLRGGSRTHDARHYERRLRSMEGWGVSGLILDGPAEIRGRYVRNEPLETDPDRIEEYAITHDLVSDANAPGS
jgi:hypothetical protein